MPAKKRTKKKIARYRKPIRINIGMIIFLFIFVYIVAQILLSLNKGHISIYEVISDSMSDNNTITGLILREENVLLAEHSGYVNFYLNDGGRAAKRDVVYTLDETGNIYTQLADSERVTDTKEPSETEAAIQDLLLRYRKDGDVRFQAVYPLRESILAEILQTSSASMLSGLKDVLETYGDNSGFHVVRAGISGIVTIYTDGCETKTKEAISYADFDTETSGYQKSLIGNASLIEEGSAVCKVLPSESWSIILPIDEEQYKKLSERDYVDIIIRRDGVKTNAAVSVYQKNGEFFAELRLQRYMVRYANQRFLDISISLNSVVGLKIPQSAIVEKQFFKVPLEFFTEGGDSSSDGLVKERYTEKGEIEYQYITTDIYYKDEECAYIAADEELQAGDRIRKTDSEDNYVLSETATLEGVYNANKGYAVFRRIEILYENEEYCIVADNTSYGLSEYDHIILQGEMAQNQTILR